MAKEKKKFGGNYKTYDTSSGFGNAQDWAGAFRERMSKDEARQILAAQGDPAHLILGVSADATKAEIVKAFRKLIMIWHPDRNSEREEEATAMTRNIIAAYTELTE